MREAVVERLMSVLPVAVFETAGVPEKEGEKVVVLEMLGEVVWVLDTSGDLLEEEEEVTVLVGKVVREAVESREVDGESDALLESEEV